MPPTPSSVLRFFFPRVSAWGRTAGLAVALALTGCGSLPPNTSRTASHALPAATSTRLAQQVAALTPPASRQETTAPDQRAGFRLLGTVESAYGSRLALIDAAEKTLDLQYYSIHYDSSTEALMEHLAAAAARGVRVRVLIDDFNAAGENAKVLRLDSVPGIEVRLFNPVSGPRASQVGRIVGSLFDFQRIQQRMHNKAFIADNVMAVTGGRNLGDEYFGQGEKSNFLDLDLLVAGPLVQQLSRSFDTYWNHELAYPARTLLTPAERERLLHPRAAPVPTEVPLPETHPATPTAAAPAGDTPPPKPVPGAAGIARQILDGRLQLTWAPAVLLSDHPSKIDSDDPDDQDETVVGDLMRLIEQTRSDLLIVSPYFVPGDKMMGVFESLRARGVRVRVLTNSLASNDAPLAHVGYARYRPALLRAGVELYELQSRGDTRRRILGSTPQSRSSLHSKALVVDGRLLVVGSMNLDLRSALQNTEVGIVIRSRPLSREMTENIEESFADSYRLELQGDRLRWHPPAHDRERAGQVLEREPDASTGLQLMLKVIGPFAPDEML
ncbi:phospholipase D family protein [uncultured Xylophilus sp.]|uniref:phospholipase D family protein n=1 Tax=uncultured Xylophilus sp. TaxID=296832 RepID=UPI0025CFCB66|nr:phospholipase D family protein [uncultured Xylophilus sp.]